MRIKEQETRLIFHEHDDDDDDDDDDQDYCVGTCTALYFGIPEDGATALKHVKFKLKFALEQTTKAQRGSRGIALLFL